MKIHLIAFGKLKAPGLRDATDYYLRNLKPWAAVRELELRQHEISDRTPALRAQAQRKEAEKLDEQLSKLDRARTRVLVLDERGAQWSTDDWARKVGDWQLESVGDLVVCIGSATGFLPEWVKKNASATVSFGKQTVSHEIARLIVAEQLYRAFAVLKNHPYHIRD